MKCPGCAKQVPDETVVCSFCGAVCDPSLLDNRPPEADGPTEPAARPLKTDGGPGVIAPGAKKVVPKRPGGTGVGPAIKRTTGASPSKRPGNAMPEAPVRKVREAQAEAEWRVKPGDEPVRAPPPRTTSGSQMVDPESLWADSKQFVGELTTADKLAFSGAFLALISCFFPWKDTITEGDVLGLMSLGAAVFAVCILIILAIFVRVKQVMPQLHALIPWLVQFGGACFCIVWCLVYVKLSLDTTVARSPIGNFERWVSSPSFGVFIALLTSVVTLAGTLMGLKEKPR